MICENAAYALKEKADLGEPKAILDYARHLNYVEKDEQKANDYYKKLAEFTPEELNFLGYATFLTYLGRISFDEGDYREAIRWYNKAMNYIKDNYSEEFGREVIDDIELEASYIKAVLAGEKQKPRNA